METNMTLFSADKSLPVLERGNSPYYGWSDTFSLPHFMSLFLILHISSNTCVLVYQIRCWRHQYTSSLHVYCPSLKAKPDLKEESQVRSTKNDKPLYPVIILLASSGGLSINVSFSIYAKENSSLPTDSSLPTNIRSDWISSAKALNQETNFIL